MDQSLFQVVERAGGWGLLDDGKPILWFPEMDSALATARIMADARCQFTGKRTRVQAQGENGTFELVFAYE